MAGDPRVAIASGRTVTVMRGTGIDIKDASVTTRSCVSSGVPAVTSGVAALPTNS